MSKDKSDVFNVVLVFWYKYKKLEEEVLDMLKDIIFKLLGVLFIGACLLAFKDASVVVDKIAYLLGILVVGVLVVK